MGLMVSGPLNAQRLGVWAGCLHPQPPAPNNQLHKIVGRLNSIIYDKRIVGRRRIDIHACIEILDQEKYLGGSGVASH